MKQIVTTLMSIGILFGCQQGPSEGELAKMVEAKVESRIAEIESKEKKNLETIGRLLQGFSTGNTDQVNELVHDDFKNHNAPEGLQDKQGFKEIIKRVNGAFSTFDELDLKPAHLFAKGDMVAMMDLGTGMKNGKKYNHIDIHIFKMKDGQMYEHWNSFGLPSQNDILMKFLEESN